MKWWANDGSATLAVATSPSLGLSQRRPTDTLTRVRRHPTVIDQQFTIHTSARPGISWNFATRLSWPTAAMAAPPQQYRFLDVGADELRGTFISPARSEQRLLYQEASWRLGFDRGFSAHYLLPPVSLFASELNTISPIFDPSVACCASLFCRLSLTCPPKRLGWAHAFLQICSMQAKAQPDSEGKMEGDCLRMRAGDRGGW